MITLAGIGFTAPWILLALAILPLLWILLRAVPPAPIRRKFPGVALMLGLTDDESVSDRTPWWLLLLRLLAVAALIIGLAGPILNPDQNTETSNAPLLVLVDGTWAGASDWPKARDAAVAQITKLSRTGRPVALLVASEPQTPVFQNADAVTERLSALSPNPWQPAAEPLRDILSELQNQGPFDTLWISDGLTYPEHDALRTALQDAGTVSVMQPSRTALGLRPATYTDGIIELSALRAQSGISQEISVIAHGPDPSGSPSILARVPLTFERDATEAQTELSLQPEIRARITHFSLEGYRSAATTSLVDDSLRRREVALISGRGDEEALQLLSPLFYLEQALSPTTDLLKAPLDDVLPANPDVIVLADIATLAPAESEALQEWLTNGGLLLRFAGPRIAASGISRFDKDPLMPVRLRSGGRSVGGAMSWGEPKALAPFTPDSPFFGLDIPEDVRITSQVMAQPDPQLSQRVIAELTDGTPLITRKQVGQGQVVFFHVTAHADWSNLPISGLFVQMLERISVIAGGQTLDAGDMDGTTWQPVRVLDAFGTLQTAGNLPGVAGPDLLSARLGPALPPGVYQTEDRAIARNVISDETELTPVTWPNDVTLLGLDIAREQPIGGLLLSFALLALMLDIIATLALSGRLIARPSAAALCALIALSTPLQLDAQDTDFAVSMTSELVLAHVITGDASVDEIAQAGLRGLSDALFFRTSIEPTDPFGVNLETDELAFFPILYWPISTQQPRPSAEAYAKLNAYLRSGGMILFDTRDANTSGFGGNSPTATKLEQIAAPLDIPRLEPIPSDHVLTRTFYLLQDFPGRFARSDVWVEAAPPDAEQANGMPFRNLNDGVTPVVIGGNDWASAWAVTTQGAPMLPVGRGFAGERQRELAFRFGINLVMHVLTGNYKSDQVHVPALLDRLGQ